MRSAALLAMFVAGFVLPAHSQQVADSLFRPPLPKPTFKASAGPVVGIDGGHHNFHTADGRFYPFASLLTRDGYRVVPLSGPFTPQGLKQLDILVIANALNERNVEDWSLPTPSAFTDEEIAVVERWVRDGGSLLLIADHMPFGGAAEAMAAAFGFQFSNGFAMDSLMGGLVAFRRRDGSLRGDQITDGFAPGDRVDSVRSFTGQAFTGSQGVTPILVLPPGTTSLLPAVAWQFDSTTKRLAAGGALQGATALRSKGRVAAFGEAAMFTAQLAGPGRTPMGMNSPEAPQNFRLVLNLLRWLAGPMP